MQDEGIIEPSSSEWVAPIVPVKNKDGSLRLCVDNRRLNRISLTDAYPMPKINDLIDELGKASFITTLDLTHGYWLVPVAKKDRHKTAFITPFWVISIQANAVWPTGSTGDIPADYGSSYTGQYESVSAYLDDLVIFSNSWEEHLRHLREVLHRLEEAGLTARLK